MWLLLLEPVFCKEGKILVHVPVCIWRLLGLLCLGALNSSTDVKIRSWYSVIIPIEIKRFFFFFLKNALKSAKPSHTWAVQGGQAQVPLLAHGLQEGQQEQGSKYHSRVCPCICDGFKLRVWGDLGKMWILATVPDWKYLGNTEPGGWKYISGVSFSRRKNSIKLSLRQMFKRIKGNSLVIRY